MIIMSKEKSRIIGISLPENIINQLDKERGDITRSRYILRIIEREMQNNG